MKLIRPLQKSFKFGVKRFGKWSRNSRRQAIHSIDNRPGQSRKRTVQTKGMVKNTREKLRTIPRRLAIKLAAETGISQTSMRRILKEDLKTFPYKMLKRHELTPTHERMRVERCRHLLSLMEDGMLPNLMFSDENKFNVSSASTIKTTVFGVGMHPWKAGE